MKPFLFLARQYCCHLALMLAACLPWAVTAAPRLQLAAAADLALCIGELNAGFIRRYGNAEIRTSIGSSGNFYAQIRSGAPYELFLSADTFYPEQLAAAGLAERETLLVYAHGRLALWTTKAGIDPNGGLSVLARPEITRIAIANPEFAPYGRAARAALQQAGIWEAVQHKLIFGENIAQVAQFVETGNAQVGLVGSAHVRRSRGNAWLLPVNSYPLIEQGAIITARGSANPVAREYLKYLQSEEARAVLRKYGFGLPRS